MLSLAQTDPIPPVQYKRLLARLLLAGLISALVVALLLLWYLGGERYKAELRIDFLPDKIKLVQGEGEEQADSIIIRSFTEQGLALLSSPRGFAFQTDQLDRFHWCLTGANTPFKLRLLWTVSALPGQVHTADLDAHNGCHSFDLSPFESWYGLADGLGLQLEGKMSEPLTLSAISLRPAPPSVFGLFRELWRDWSTYQGWHASSVNFIRLGALPALAPVALVVFVWAVISALLYYAFHSGRLRLPIALLAYAITAWLALDGLWQWELAQRALDNYRLMAGKPLQERLRYYDGELISTLTSLRAELPPAPQRIFILGDETKRTQKARLHYHLLPHNVYSYGAQPPPPELARPGDYLLILGRIKNVRYRNQRGREALLWGQNNQYQLAVKPLLADQIGALLVVREQ